MLSNNNCIIYCINKNEVTKHEIIFFIFYKKKIKNIATMYFKKMKKSELKFRFVIFLIM